MGTINWSHNDKRWGMLDATIVAKLCSLFCFYFKENWENLKGKKYASPWMM